MKNTKVRASLKILGWAAVFSALFAGTIYLAWLEKTSFEGFLLNTFCFVLMFLLICWGFLFRWNRKSLSALVTAEGELRNAHQVLSSISKDMNLDQWISEEENQDSLFKMPTLKEAFHAHRLEVDRLQSDKSDFKYVDIADHLNSGLLDRIGNASFNDLVSGSMTGIGILGTFVGLTVGLRNFDSSTADAMIETIPTLIDGIKIAFLTSIAGVVFSILYNLCYRSVLENATAAMNDFLNLYYERVLPRPENDSMTKLVTGQQLQSESMNQFAEQISMKLANQLEENVVPTFNGIQESIQQLADRLAETQNQNMGKIADEFVRNIDQSMGNQIQHLGENINDLCQWQESTLDKMRSCSQMFEENVIRLDSVGGNLDQFICSIDTYVHKMEMANEKLTDRYLNITTETEKLVQKMSTYYEQTNHILDNGQKLLEEKRQIDSDHVEKLAKIIEMTEQYRKSIADSSTMILQKLEDMSCETIHEISGAIETTMNNMVNSITAAMDEHLEHFSDNMRETIEKQKEVVEEMKSASQKLEESSQDISAANKVLSQSLDTTLDRTFQQIDHQMAEVVLHLSGTISKIEDVTEQVPHMLMESIDQTQKANAGYLKSITEGQSKIIEIFTNHQNDESKE